MTETPYYWGVHEDVYCAGKEGTFQFLEDVLTEVMAVFPCTYLHIGGDEVRLAAPRCPAARTPPPPASRIREPCFRGFRVF